MKPAIRSWCAVAKYPELDRFLAGSVVIAAEATSQEIEEALRGHFLRFLPPGFDIIKPRCGALHFVGDEAA